MSLQEEPGKSAVSPMDGSSLQQLDEKHNIYTYSRSTQMYAASLTVRVINSKKHIYNSISQNSLKITFYIRIPVQLFHMKCQGLTALLT